MAMPVKTYWFRPGRLEKAGRRNPGKLNQFFYNLLHHFHYQEFWLLGTSLSLLHMSLQRILFPGVIAASIA
jgi:hypothetical protein